MRGGESRTWRKVAVARSGGKGGGIPLPTGLPATADAPTLIRPSPTVEVQ